jgi:hypothetical protein
MFLSLLSACRSRAITRIGLMICLIALVARTAPAQDATEPALKSALVFNFAKFTTWPSDVLPRSATLVACVVGSHDVSAALQRAVRDRQLDGHAIAVSDRDLDDPRPSFRTCHLLYVTGSDPKQVARRLDSLRGAPVLTIVDVDDPALAIGIANVFVENGRMRFRVDNSLAREGRLEISSRLLSLAAGVRDNARRDALGNAR